MRSLVRIIGVLMGLGLALFMVLPAQAAAIVVTPETVRPGGTVTISGNVLVPPDNHVPGGLAHGDQVTLISNAFPGGQWGPAGSVNVDVVAEGDQSMLPPGAFIGQATIRSDAAPGDYTVSGRFGGGNIGVLGHFTVVAATPTQPSAQPGLPGTGQPAAPAAAQMTTVQLPAWWPAALAGLLVLVLSPWVGIALLRRGLR